MKTIDLSCGQSQTMLDRVIDDARAWVGADVGPNRCVLAIEKGACAEIEQLLEQMRRHPLPTLLRAPAQFEMPTLRALMAAAKALLDEGPGVAVIDRLPLDEITAEEATALFWVLGQLIGRPVAQKWDGTILYDVMDTGESFSYGVRGSYTNIELVFHNDNAFSIALPHYVGLMCVRPAKAGGVSRFCSLYTIHNRMLADHHRELERLYRPLTWDRQAEHVPDGPKVALAPVFSYDGKQLSARVNTGLVRSGYALADVGMDAETRAALAALERVVDDPTLWFELPIERGQLQYLNNREIVHYRSRFTDHPDPTLRRHLIRTWHRDTGRPSYDG